MKYHLIPTLDYEIFGNGSGSLHQCLVKPTDICLEIAESHSATITFFIDALEFLHIKRAYEEGLMGLDSLHYYPDVEAQIKSIVSSVHNIQLHLHPQWLDAVVRNDGWSLNYNKWRIGDLDSDEISSAISEGLSYLRSFTEPHAQRPCLDVFRAGGWAIQPGKSVLKQLSAEGVVQDSTVAPGLVNHSAGDWYDYRNTPGKPFWSISDDVCREDAAGNMLEVPIATQFIGRRAHLKALKESRLSSILANGCHGTYVGPNSRWQSLRGKMGKLMNIGTIMLDFSTIPAWALIEATRRFISRYSSYEKPVPIVIIGHNKNFTDRSADNFDMYLSWVAEQPDICFSDYHHWLDDIDVHRNK